MASTNAVAFASLPPVPAVSGPERYRDAALTRRNMGGPALVANGDPLMRRSKDSAYMVPHWDRVDAIVSGIDAMRDGDFMQRFTEEDDADFTFRRNCSKMTNVYRDIVEGLASKPFEKEVNFAKDANKAVPQELLEFIENVDGSSNNLTVFAGETFFNGINAAIDWIFVDFSKRDPTVRSIADMKQKGLRPYWSHVLGRNILDVQSEVINSEETLTYIKIFEPGDVDHIREFERVAATETTAAYVKWTLWKWSGETTPAAGETRYVVEDSGTVSIGVIPLVPFITGRREGRSWRMNPPMKDAADLQVELFLQESGLKFAKILTAYPMLAANGITPPKGPDGKPLYKVAVGPNRVLWSTMDASGNVGSWSYLEPSSESLKFLAEDIKETIQQIRELGRQPLTAQAGNITVITAAVAAGKAASAVKVWALKLKDTIENALVMTAMYYGIKPGTYDPTVDVYLEFDEFVDGKDLESLDADRDRGDISQETLWEEKKRRGVYSEEFTPDRERERLLAEVPSDGPDITGDAP